MLRNSFVEDFLLRARRRVTDTVHTAAVDRITATDIEEQLMKHYGAHLARKVDGMRELIHLTLEGKSLYALLDSAKKSHEKIKTKSGEAEKKPECQRRVVPAWRSGLQTCLEGI